MAKKRVNGRRRTTLPAGSETEGAEGGERGERGERETKR